MTSPRLLNGPLQWMSKTAGKTKLLASKITVAIDGRSKNRSENRGNVIDLDQTVPLTHLGPGLINQTCLVALNQCSLWVIHVIANSRRNPPLSVVGPIGDKTRCGRLVR